MNHEFYPPEYICQICGGHENDHYWKCEIHNVSGNGSFNCLECRIENSGDIEETYEE